MTNTADFITPVDPVDADTFGLDYPPKWFVKYPPGVLDDYGHTGYYFRTKRGAVLMARRALAAKPGSKIMLTKDWTT